MQLHCEKCRSPFRAEDVRLDIAVARCHVCDTAHDLSVRKAPEQAVVRSRPTLVRAKAALPPGLQVEDEGTATRISWRWFGLKHLLLLGFCIVWDGALLAVYTSVLTSGNAPLVSLLFPLIHVGVGVWLTYTALAGLLNRTEIDVSRAELTIRHGPLPWPGNKTLPGRSLAQLYVGEVFTKRNASQTAVYNLLAVDREGRKVTLLTNLEEKDQALYLEQVLEQRLGIEDASVDGELATRTQVA
jgi:hypothetical protein